MNQQLFSSQVKRLWFVLWYPALNLDHCEFDPKNGFGPCPLETKKLKLFHPLVMPMTWMVSCKSVMSTVYPKRQ
jgi:hypothetical protein